MLSTSNVIFYCETLHILLQPLFIHHPSCFRYTAYRYSFSLAEKASSLCIIIPYQHKASSLCIIIPYQHKTASLCIIIPYQHKASSLFIIIPYQHKTSSLCIIIPYQHKTQRTVNGVRDIYFKVDLTYLTTFC